ncbi:uncharacterized protein LOC132286796 isoform X1 [Cornus florida]|uniref:uncharacterized protein LOC132286796 isoform X1 n=1 Tax=Cornus florida TaxID=4283 RepID=UPI00289EEEEA|nr:uncharacterized protein LOC132286796 isoform X1 [Cornus florida]
MGKSWGDYRTRLTTDIYKSNVDTEAIDSLKPDSVQSIEEWQQFVTNRLSDDYKREKCQELRKKQKMPHTTSRKGYARLEDEMRKKSDAPDFITRVDVWIEGHMRKGGKPLNDVTEEAVKQMKEYTKTQPKGTSSLRDDGVTHVLGPERKGRVRGLGFGATISKIEANGFQRVQAKRVEEIVKERVEQIKHEMKMK